MAALRAPLELSALESGHDGAALGVLGQAEGHFARGASQFFGVNGYGQTFVYVVDCSGSMRNSGKLERAKYELLHSIEQLSGDQKYFVIFYNQTAIPMNEQAPVDAGDATLAQTRRWIEMVEPGGGTNPLPALLAALALKPDTIFFLSDGLFDSNTISQVRTINRRRGRVPIHSIAFVSRENLALMRAIARDSGGEFRFVK
jgi:Ca-activated chloride channel family protein